jgi:hypothetical protein
MIIGPHVVISMGTPVVAVCVSTIPYPMMKVCSGTHQTLIGILEIPTKMNMPKKHDI